MNRSLSLAGVAIGAAGVSGALTAAYQGMRDVMVEHGGSCVSGGPYQAAPGHTCNSSETLLLTIAPFVALALTALLVAASNVWSDDRISGIGALVFGATFATLGWNFIDLGIHPPAEMSGAGVWILCGALFWAIALGGFVFSGYGMRDYLLGEPDDPAVGAAPPPLVRAAVNVRAAQMSGVPLPATSTALLFPGRAGSAPTAAGSPGIWLATVLASAAAGAAAFVTLW